MIVLGICYRPPNSLREDEVAYFALVRSISENSKQVLLFGDFNMPNIDWSMPRGRSERDKEFLEKLLRMKRSIYAISGERRFHLSKMCLKLIDSPQRERYAALIWIKGKTSGLKEALKKPYVNEVSLD